MDEEAGCTDAREMQRHVPKHLEKRLLDGDLAVPRESLNSCWGRKHVVVVMNALKEFSTKPLEWAVENLAEPGYIVTLLGVMPWPSFPLFCKTRSDIWNLGFEDLSTMNEWPEWKNDAHYLKLQKVVKICEAHGVVPLKELAVGHPEQSVVLERTTNLHATWVVFDRHHRKWSTYYKERVPCNIVIMNGDGQVDVLKMRSVLDRGKTHLRSFSCIGSTST